MAKSIMVQGTMSNTGKSVITAGLCRIFKQDGYNPAPFKSQNMALNSFVTADGGEMGRAQAMQAEACGILPDVRMNPILLKPTSSKGSQIILNGTAIGTFEASECYDKRREMIPHIMNAYNSLAREYDIIVLEGAGSPAEINLKDNDIVNMGMSAMAKAPVLLAGDIDRGGVFASLAGTMLLFTDEERSRVKGTVINKFRGDVSLLRPGLDKLEKLIDVPVLGVIPYLQLDLDDEDSLSSRLSKSRSGGLVDIAVIRLPHLSNFTDFSPFEHIPDVDLRYVGSARELMTPDLIIIPGTKNTIHDMLWLRESGLATLILKHASNNKPVFGICGGYQMLGMSISDPLDMEHGGTVKGLELLDHETEFSSGKVTRQTSGRFEKLDGIFSPLSGLYFTGYEIHMGETNNFEKPLHSALTEGSDSLSGGQNGNIYGSYVHGIFDSEAVAQGIVYALLKEKGLDSALPVMNMKAYKESQYNALADALRKSLNISRIYDILWKGL